jgi:hypothetical protein
MLAILVCLLAARDNAGTLTVKALFRREAYGRRDRVA